MIKLSTWYIWVNIQSQFLSYYPVVSSYMPSWSTSFSLHTRIFQTLLLFFQKYDITISKNRCIDIIKFVERPLWAVDMTLYILRLMDNLDYEYMGITPYWPGSVFNSRTMILPWFSFTHFIPIITYKIKLLGSM